MIDIHSHILPNVDDGAETDTVALAMAQAAIQEGITHIVATPHHMNRHYDNPKAEVLNKVDRLNERLQEAGIPLTVLPGQEIRVFGEFLEAYESGDLLTVDNQDQYVLIEFPTGHVPRYAEQLVYDLQIAGLTPVIVHPERNNRIIQDPDVLYNLIAGGAVSQVTAASLTGQFGRKLKKFSFDLVEHQLTHIIASDAHNTTTRAFHMRSAFEALEDAYGASVRYIFEENSQRLVEGNMINQEPPSPVKTKKFLGLF
ncbi:tyrosine-protein phosphatase [Tuberibacillus sp. Marseille-P3662]|uniref:tyrosine-protein phosphatase n=1 Tax=Tuberibacillus sp. Marseille-P3662 TaxID=1965358 RepID=UPI000A1C7F03|nr:CpsB/CapC family capsule biosynthesis tyrosine phosphatase [Tuberibacillus sp. Marseille-P3662]